MKTQLLQQALNVQALRFGAFTLKSGRQSPYFFNAGQFHHGEALAVLAQAYAQRIQQYQHDWQIEALFGPAYKGIPLVAAVAVTLQLQYGLSLPWAFNRKEAKDHGEGGVLVGANLKDKRVLILDDVLTAGTAIRESLTLLKQAEALPVAVLLILDRQEALQEGGTESALSALRQEHQLHGEALFSLDDLLAYAAQNPELQSQHAALSAYRQRYGVRV